jgi:hypothetical protein
VKQVENDMFSTIVHNYTRYEAQTKNWKLVSRVV